MSGDRTQADYVRRMAPVWLAEDAARNRTPWGLIWTIILIGVVVQCGAIAWLIILSGGRA